MVKKGFLCFLACAVQGAKPPSLASAEGASREGMQRPSSFLLPLYGMALLPFQSEKVVKCPPCLRRCSNVVQNGEAVSSSRESFALSNDDKKRATAVVAECRTDRSGTLRTAREGKSPAESGTAVGLVHARSDTEVGIPSSISEGRVAPNAVGWSSSLPSVRLGMQVSGLLVNHTNSQGYALKSSPEPSSTTGVLADRPQRCERGFLASTISRTGRRSNLDVEPLAADDLLTLGAYADGR